MTGSTILAGVRLTLVLSPFAVLSLPASLTCTAVPILLLNTLSVLAWLGAAVVCTSVTQRTMRPCRTQTLKAVDLVHTGPSTQTWH